MRNTSLVGEISRMQVMAALARQGKHLLIPLGDFLRYDCGFDEDGQFYRVQCKNGVLRKGAVVFYSCSVNSRSEKGRCIRKKYAGEIDFFGVFCPDNGKCYMVPASEVPGYCCTLRCEAPKNGQKSRLRWAKDYELK